MIHVQANKNISDDIKQNHPSLSCVLSLVGLGAGTP